MQLAGTSPGTAKGDEQRGRSDLQATYQEIQALCDVMHLTQQIANMAKHLFKMTRQTKTFKGMLPASIIASCIFITCRQSNNLRTFKEITTLTKVPKKEIGRTFKLLEKFLQRHTADQAVVVSGGAAVTQEKCCTVTLQYCSTSIHNGLRFSRSTELHRPSQTFATSFTDLHSFAPFTDLRDLHTPS